MIDFGIGHIRIPGFSQKGGFPFSYTYQPQQGIVPLIDAICEYEKKPAENILVTTGASLGLISSLCLLPKGSVVLCPSPYYPAYPVMIRNLGLQVQYYFLDKENNWDIILDSILNTDTKNVSAIIINLPGNPAGNMCGRSTFKKIIDFAKKYEIKIISDEAYAHIIYSGEIITSVPYIFQKNIIVVKSLSKLLMLPGERIGYIVANSTLIESLKRIHWSIAMSAPAYGQFRAAQLLQQNEMGKNSLIVDGLRKNRTIVDNILASSTVISYQKPKAGIFYWIEINKDKAGLKEFYRKLNKKKIIVMPGHLFGEKFENYIRINIAVPKNELEKGLKEIISIF
jgi:aspartate/methionine/tyrosine aminotransferase